MFGVVLGGGEGEGRGQDENSTWDSADIHNRWLGLLAALVTMYEKYGFQQLRSCCNPLNLDYAYRMVTRPALIQCFRSLSFTPGTW